MWIIGITGAQGAGKSTLSRHLKREGVPVHSADKAIHSLLRRNSEVRARIKALWPQVFIKEKIDRTLLGECVLSSSSSLAQLEDILYPHLARLQKRFLLKGKRLRVPVVALDVPLLFEVRLDPYCHVVILASAPLSLRRERVLARKGMTLQKFQYFENHQMKEEDREKRADFIIHTGREKERGLKKIQDILSILSKKPSPEWQNTWPKTFKREPYDQRNCFRHRNNRI